VNSILRSPLRGINRFPLRGVLRDDAPFFLRNALVLLDEDGITGVDSVSEWTNSSPRSSDFDTDVIVGTPANLMRHLSDAGLFYGAISDTIFTANAAANRIIGDIDLRVRINLANYSPTNAVTLLSKISFVSDQRAYWFVLTALGELQLLTYSDGTLGTQTVATSSELIPTTGGDFVWGRVTLDVDNGASDSDTTFFTADGNLIKPVASDFTQLGLVRNSGGVLSIFASSARVEIGSAALATTSLIRGNVPRAQIFNGIDGTLAVEFNAADYINKTSDTQFPSSVTGEIWELSGDSFIQNTGKTVVHSIGSAGLETTAGQDISSPGTVFVVMRYSDSTPAGDQAVFDARASLSKRWLLALDQSASNVFAFQGEGSFPLTSLANDTDPHVITCQFNGDSTTKITISGVGSFTGDDVGSDDLQWGTVFADATGGSSMQGYIATLIVFDRKLKESEVSSMKVFLEKEYRI